jgi:hypothetical protein
VKGRVVDVSTDQPLAFCNVFINNSTFGATTTPEGYFEIKDIPVPGSYEIIVSYVGYESVTQKIDISESATLRTIFLKPSETVLSSVEIQASRDKAWEKKLKRFTKIFLGTDKQAEQCTILNPWVMDFPDSRDRSFTAKASSPIEIENKALGYKVRFFLIQFSSNATDYSIVGKSFFEEMIPGSHEEAARWRNERARSYQNSRQHLFKAIVNRRVAAEGLKLYTELPNTTRRRPDAFTLELGRSVLPADTLSMVTPGPQKNVFGVRLEGRLEIHNMREKDNASIYRDVLHPISWIESKSGLIYVDKDGFELNSGDALAYGAMNEQRVSRLVPTNYKPAEKTVIETPADEIGFVREKLYAHTDKPYYYPGETMWFKGYVRYKPTTLKDSLSSTVYAELIGADKKIVASKVLEVIDGSFQNEFVLSDTLAAGDYFLRCYTNLNRNFGNDKLFIKYLPVIEMTQVVDLAANDTTKIDDVWIAIASGKPVFRTREKIVLEILPRLEDLRLLAGADLSISVTDMKQVVPVNTSPAIVDGLELGNDASAKFSYAVERGFGFKATYDDLQEKSNEMLLHVFQLEPKYYTIAQADRLGTFSVAGLNFYDSAWLTIIPTGNNETQGDVIVWRRDIPAVYLPEDYPKIVTQQTELRQRAGEYETEGVTMLQEIEVKASRIDEQSEVRRPYGKPDFVLAGQKIRGDRSSNLLFSLQGKVPGLMIRQLQTYDGMKWFVYLQRNTNRGRLPPQVQVTVNNNLMTGTPEEILTSIVLSTVESVELNHYSGVLYGNKSANGILSIYTNPNLLQLPSPAAKKILIHGYSRARKFQSPDYSAPDARNSTHEDLRSTIYWNPNITLDEKGEAKVEFYAADLKGHYRIVVEGTAPDGTPVRAEKVITIKDR